MRGTGGGQWGTGGGQVGDRWVGQEKGGETGGGQMRGLVGERVGGTGEWDRWGGQVERQGDRGEQRDRGTCEGTAMFTASPRRVAYPSKTAKREH